MRLRNVCNRASIMIGASTDLTFGQQWPPLSGHAATANRVISYRLTLGGGGGIAMNGQTTIDRQEHTRKETGPARDLAPYPQ